jgi:hypothetical protein
MTWKYVNDFAGYASRRPEFRLRGPTFGLGVARDEGASTVTTSSMQITSPGLTRDGGDVLLELAGPRSCIGRGRLFYSTRGAVHHMRQMQAAMESLDHW